MIFPAISAKRRFALLWGLTDWKVSGSSFFCPAPCRPFREVPSERQPFFSASGVFSLPVHFCRSASARRCRRTRSGSAREFRAPSRKRPLSGIPSRGSGRIPGCRPVSGMERREHFSRGVRGRLPDAGQAGLCDGRLRLSCRFLFPRCRGSRSVPGRDGSFRARGASRARAPLPGTPLCSGRRGACRL